MRKITKIMLDAVNGQYDRKLSNTEVENYNGDIYVYLHNNNIFKHDIKANEKIFSSCGWYSNTTKERLNALMPEGFAIVQRSFEWYVMNREGLYIKWFDNITYKEIENAEYKTLKEL